MVSNIITIEQCFDNPHSTVCAYNNLIVVIIFSQEGWLSVSQAVAGQTTEREGACSGLPHICRPVLRRAHEINQRRQVCVSTKGDDEIFSRGPTLCKLVVIDSM